MISILLAAIQYLFVFFLLLVAGFVLAMGVRVWMCPKDEWEYYRKCPEKINPWFFY